MVETLELGNTIRTNVKLDGKATVTRVTVRGHGLSDHIILTHNASHSITILNKPFVGTDKGKYLQQRKYIARTIAFIGEHIPNILHKFFYH